jgi:hypothetical protein
LTPSRRPFTFALPPGLALAAVCCLALLAASTGIRDESYVSLDGDMPRYLMNGVFLRDALVDFPAGAPLDYARHYYARYPALSLGHHPVLPAVAQVPFFLLFGVSVFSARASIVVALVVTIFFWFRLLRDLYDVPTALFSCLLLLSTPGLVPLFQVVLSEPYAIALIVAAVYFMHRYGSTERPIYAWAFFVAAVLSVYAKQLAAVMFPVYAFQFVAAFGVRALWRRSTLLVVGAIACCMVPLVLLTLRYSAFNVQIMTEAVRPGQGLVRWNLLRFLRRLWYGQFGLTVPLMALSAASIVVTLWRRDLRAMLFVVWAVVVYAAVVLVGIGNDRFVCYWLPAFCALAAALYQFGSTNRWRTSCAVLLTITIGYQAWLGVRRSDGREGVQAKPVGAGGYEEAARYVAEHRLGDTVLYSAAIDTGYFVFFARKYDPHREMVILRADKTLTTSRMRRLDFERRINRPEEIVPILQRNGVGYVVIEGATYPDGPLRWLQDVVKTDDFRLRLQVPIESRDRRVQRAMISVYEYTARMPADRSTPVSINIPVANDRIEVTLGDLLESATPR